MAKLKKHGKAGKVVMKRDSKAGRFIDIRIADPEVKPRETSVREIRKAADSVLARRKRA